MAIARQFSNCIKRYDFRSVCIKYWCCSVVGDEGAVVNLLLRGKAAGVNKDDYLKESAAQQNQQILNLPAKPFSYFSILPLYDNSAVLIVPI